MSQLCLNFRYDSRMTSTAKRDYGSGGIQWLSARRARLRVRLPGETTQRSKVVRVRPKDHGGLGDAKAEMEKFAADLRLERARAERTVHTVDELFTAYVAHCRRVGRRPGTVESYESAAKRLTPALKAMPIEDLTGRDVDQFYGELSQRLSANTIRQTHAVLRAALAQAVKWGWIAGNPADAATPPQKVTGTGRVIEPADARRMYLHAATARKDGGEGDDVLAMAVALATITGARRGELAGLRWEDIDTRAGVLTIERQWIPGGDEGQYLGPLKSGKMRTVALGADGVAFVEAYKERMKAKLRREPDGWLLSEDAGITPVKAKGLGASIGRLAKNLGIDATTHTFRHVSASELAMAGVDRKTAADRLGHTPEVMDAVYLHGADDKATAAGAALEARLADRGFALTWPEADYSAA